MSDKKITVSSEELKKIVKEEIQNRDKKAKDKKKEKNKKPITLYGGVKVSIYCVVVILALLIGYVGGINVKTNKEDKAKRQINMEAVNEITEAYNSLLNGSDPYIIATQADAPGVSTSYMETVLEDKSSYTEYTITEDGIGTTPSDTDIVSYVVTDWFSEDGTLYQIDSPQEGTFNKMPASFSNFMHDRQLLFVPTILQEAYVVTKEKESISVEIEEGVEDNLTLYTLKIPDTLVRKIVCADTVTLNDCIKSDTDDKNIIDYCTNLNNDYLKSAIFSDGEVSIAVDTQGRLRYMNMVTGGLGLQLYYTKAVQFDVVEDELREVPDFSSSRDYIQAVVKNVADYAASYGSWDAYVNAMSSSSVNEQEEADTEEENDDKENEKGDNEDEETNNENVTEDTDDSTQTNQQAENEVTVNNTQESE